MLATIDKTDPLPKPPEINPREDMPLEQQKRFIASGEHIRLTAYELLFNPRVKIEYPSGFVETLGWDDFETFARKRLGLSDFQQCSLFIAYLVNFKKTVYFPNERIHRVRMTLPDGSEMFT